MMFSRLTLTAAVAAVLGVVSAADLTIISPGGSNLWWVAGSQNTLLWNCQQSQYQNFTVLLANSSPTILTAPIGLIAIEDNYQCSQTINPQLSSQAASTGYTIQLANPLNNTDIYATSQPFEIKAIGSSYPAASATPTSTAASSTGSAAASTTSKSSAMGLQAPVIALGGAVAAMLGFVV